MEIKSIEWAAGLFEGEGCITIRDRLNEEGKRTQVRLILKMTDRDVVEAFRNVFGYGNVRDIHPPSARANPNKKPQFGIEISARDQVHDMLTQMRPHLMSRRGARADEALEVLNNYSISYATRTGENHWKKRKARNDEATGL